MNGVAFEILARTPVPKLPLSYPPPPKRCDQQNSDQSVHPPSKARVFMYTSLDSLETVDGTCKQRRLWSDSANAQADLSLR